MGVGGGKGMALLPKAYFLIELTLLEAVVILLSRRAKTKQIAACDLLQLYFCLLIINSTQGPHGTTKLTQLFSELFELVF